MSSYPFELSYACRYVLELYEEVLQVSFGQGVSKLQSSQNLWSKKVESFWVRGYSVREFT